MRTSAPAQARAARSASAAAPFEFNTIGVDDGIAMGHAGMRYSLPSREIIADSVETMIEAHSFDGAVVDLVSVFEGVGAYQSRTIDAERLKQIEDAAWRRFEMTGEAAVRTGM